MQLKEYQKRVLDRLEAYCKALHEANAKLQKVRTIDPSLAKSIDPPELAWDKLTGGKLHHKRRNGLKEPLPDIYLKVPTGGGKTLLACHAIDYIHRLVFERQMGLVVWVVPSTEIYRQTARSLKNRRHPYRQMLDVATGGRVLIREKDERFTRQDVAENLVILLLMLPSANRENKQSLRVFRDSGGFTDFFPPEDRWQEHEKMLEAFPNLDYFGGDASSPLQGAGGARQIMTSLGNALRVCKPIFIIDEGHRAWSERARNTIENLNPRFLLQLSATPPPHCNKLVEVTGRDLDREQMIKLPINLRNKRDNPDWHDTLMSALAKRDELERIALKYRQNGGKYIRPICLVQVQQTGEKLVNDHSKIHAEHARKYLIEKCGVPPQHIAMKTSDNDGLEGIDLLEESCDIRYILTKQALQEGWDCPFAYILTILSNSGSETGLTQLIGRILRQPYAQDTGVKELDECYIYTFRQSSTQLAGSIKRNLEQEGLGDIAGQVLDDSPGAAQQREIQFREKFKKFEGEIYLPKFFVPKPNGSYREFMYEADILPNIDWSSLSIERILEFDPASHVEAFSDSASVEFNQMEMLDVTSAVTLTEEADIDAVFMTRQLGSIIPNPWWSYEYTRKILDTLIEKHGKAAVSANFIRLITWAKTQFAKQVEERAEQAFEDLIDQKRLVFLLMKKTDGYFIPSRIPVRGENPLYHGSSYNKVVQRSLFEGEPDEEYNGEERAVALFLDDQEKLLWWHRNRVGERYYHIKGFQNRKVYPDFIAARQHPEKEEEFAHVHVYEYKGEHLRDNPDTRYKEKLFELCSSESWEHLGEGFSGKKFVFQMIYKDEYEQIISKDFH